MHSHKNQNFSNMLGFAMLLFFIGLIAFTAFRKQFMVVKTRRQLDDLTSKVSLLDKDALMNWASGKEIDEWGNTFVLEKNSDYVQFRSKGPDRVLNTKDDILSEACVKNKHEFRVEKSPEKSLLSKAYDKYKNWRSK